MTYLQAALTILAHATRPLSVPEITAVAVAQGLVRPRGLTPDRTMSSVLYRRMAADADAPLISRGGRVWLRERSLPAEETSYLGQPARRARSSAAPAHGGSHAPRRISILPLPPLQVPEEALRAAVAAVETPVRRERAVLRAGERGVALVTRLAARRAATGAWDAARTATRVVAPVLAHLGYRAGREALASGRLGRGRVGYILRVAGAPVAALDVWRLDHDLGADDAWYALARARESGAAYGAVANGHELRVYAAAVAEAQDSVAAAHVLTLTLEHTPAGSPMRTEQAAALWLLARRNVAAGALDSYTANRAVGAALLGALEGPDSALARALVSEVRARLGVALPAGIVLRHARLALRGQRGPEGGPLPGDVATVAAVRGPHLTLSPAGEAGALAPVVEIVSTASAG